jgi:phospho-N-acetylmuramoyl-pentapeptide-transferase
MAVAFIATALVTKQLIPFLKRVKSTQTIHEDVPENHQAKSGTPTMGGIAIIIGIVAGCAAAMAIVEFSLNLIVILLVVVVFGLVGFLDDVQKVINKRNLGLTARQKILLQFAAALVIALYYVYVADLGTNIVVPFVWKSVDVGLWIIPYIVFVMVAMVNAVNLTDGLDGLAAGITTTVSLFFPVFTVLGLALGGNVILGAAEGTLILNGVVDAMFFASLAGACLGFLIFNKHPAKIFMGDTGSLALGGGVAVAAIFTHMELLLPIAGLIFVLEALSVVLQVGSYKLRHGKRIFKMAPLHHHYELSGWPERKVVTVFISITLVLSVAITAVMMFQTAME